MRPTTAIKPATPVSNTDKATARRVLNALIVKQGDKVNALQRKEGLFSTSVIKEERLLSALTHALAAIR